MKPDAYTNTVLTVIAFIRLRGYRRVVSGVWKIISRWVEPETRSRRARNLRWRLFGFAKKWAARVILLPPPCPWVVLKLLQSC
jgi:hypothetical protein